MIEATFDKSSLLMYVLILIIYDFLQLLNLVHYKLFL